MSQQATKKLNEINLLELLDRIAITSRSIKTQEDQAMQTMINKNDYGGNLGDFWMELLKTKYVKAIDIPKIIKYWLEEERKDKTVSKNHCAACVTKTGLFESLIKDAMEAPK